MAHDLSGIAYDRAGNITTLQRYRATGTLVDNLSYSYPSSSNRLSSITDAISGNSETWDARSGSFTYDPNGNMTTAPAPYSLTAVNYDHRNVPLSLTRGGVTTSYRYDHSGHRIAKQVGSANTEVYLLDGPTTLGVFTVNGSGGIVSSYFNVVSRERIVGRQPGIGNRRYYHADLLGSTRAVVEGSTVVESYDYDPWGILLADRTLASGTKEGFTGHERDAESGLDYTWARQYLAATGRWGGIDPLAEKYPEWSPYNYVLGNPVTYSDPFGLCPPCGIDIGVGLFGADFTEHSVAEAQQKEGEAVFWTFMLAAVTHNFEKNNAGAADDGNATIDPALVRFSQKSISPMFSEGAGSVAELAAGLKAGKISAADVPAIRLVEKDGALFTIDNRRLSAFQQAGVPIRYRMATPQEIAANLWKFTTKNGGTSVRIRGEKP